MLSLKHLLPYLLLILHLQWRCWYVTAAEEAQAVNDSPKFPASCAALNEISPCTCYQHGTKDVWIQVVCQKMASFGQVIQTLRNKIERRNQIQLIIEFSDLADLSQRKFSDIDSSIVLLWLRENKMDANISMTSFEGIDTVTTLVLIESKINVFPGAVFEHMPNVEVVSIERTPVESLSPGNFKSLTKLKTLVIRACNLTYIQSKTFPITLRHIDLDRNNISTLNGTLRNITLLEWAFLARNHIESMEGQLADFLPNYKLTFLDLSFNKLTNLPISFVELYKLNQLHASHNEIRSPLSRIFRNKKELAMVDLSENRIESLSPDEFENCGQLYHLNMSHNEIWSLNGSLLFLPSLKVLDLAYNNLTEFSVHDLRAGLTSYVIDLSNNRLRKFTAASENETHLAVEQLHLEYNELETLEGFMAGVKGLKYLNMSHNRLTTIRTEFLTGVSVLEELDVSHNLLLTLHDISKADLFSLRALFAFNNQITDLSHFLGPKVSNVCAPHLQNNKIDKSDANFSEQNQCALESGSVPALYVYLDGNDVLCKDNVQEAINSVERSTNTTKIVGQCSKKPTERVVEYIGVAASAPPVVNNTPAITVVTLDH